MDVAELSTQEQQQQWLQQQWQQQQQREEDGLQDQVVGASSSSSSSGEDMQGLITGPWFEVRPLGYELLSLGPIEPPKVTNHQLASKGCWLLVRPRHTPHPTSCSLSKIHTILGKVYKM